MFFGKTEGGGSLSGCSILFAPNQLPLFGSPLTAAHVLTRQPRIYFPFPTSSYHARNACHDVSAVFLRLHARILSFVLLYLFSELYPYLTSSVAVSPQPIFPYLAFLPEIGNIFPMFHQFLWKHQFRADIFHRSVYYLFYSIFCYQVSLQILFDIIHVILDIFPCA